MTIHRHTRSWDFKPSEECNTTASAAVHLAQIVAHAGLQIGVEQVRGLADDLALMEWLQALGGRVPGRVLASSSTFQYFTAAAPGAKELVSMVKIWELTQGERWRRRATRSSTRLGSGKEVLLSSFE